MIAAELGIRSNTAPSAFQFRLGGCKGILTVWPEAKDKEVHIERASRNSRLPTTALKLSDALAFLVPLSIGRQLLSCHP
jgi:hypothetical protein